MPIAYIGIGSNIGDRHALVQQAVTAVCSAIDPAARVSPVYESAPWGYDSPHHYINLVIAASTPLPPLELLDRLQAIERTISTAPHRDSSGRYIDRPIDIDLIAVDDLVVNTPRLTLPHPRMHLRPFVLVPMSTVAPAWLHPLLHLTLPRLLTSIPSDI